MFGCGKMRERKGRIQLNTTQLKYFLEAADSLNISRSAEKLFISQQALSSQIIKLEKSLGMALFERKPKLRLTYAGERLYHVAKDILQKQAALEKEFEEINLEERGTITIGISFTRGRCFLPLVLPEFHERFPGVELKLKEGNSHQLKTYLDDGSVDFVIAADQFARRDYETTLLLKEKLFWSYTEKFRTAVEQDRLEEVPFVLMTKDNRVRSIIDQYFERRAIRPHVLIATDNIETALSLAAKGMGVTVYLEMFLKNSPYAQQESTGLQFRPVGDSATDTVLVAAWKKGRYVNKFEKVFLEICRKNV